MVALHSRMSLLLGRKDFSSLTALGDSSRRKTARKEEALAEPEVGYFSAVGTC